MSEKELDVQEVPPIPIPLKKKYLTRGSTGHPSKSGNSHPKKKTIWKLLAQNAQKMRKRG